MTPRTLLLYCGYVLLWTAIITVGGAVVGALMFPLVGTLAGMDMTPASMALSGAKQLGFLAFIWAVGIAIVMAFQHAHRRRRTQAPPPASSSTNDG